MMELIDQVKRDEGLRLTPYRDSVGKLTIGYGTNLDDGISKEEAEYLLANRLHAKQIELAQRIPWVTTLAPARRAVLENMAYNMGVAGLMGFKQMLAAVQKGDFMEASRQMLSSLWAKQVGIRATRLAQQMINGEFC